PQAAEFAHRELVAMGPLDRTQKIVLGIFVTTCALWLTSQFHRLGISEVALLGACGLFLSGVLTWEDAVSEKAAWDVFIWYGGLVSWGEALKEFGVTQASATGIGSYLGSLGCVALLAAILPLYFYAHYAFASITTHILSMYPVFLALLLLR